MTDRVCTAARVCTITHRWQPLEGPADAWQHPDANWLYGEADMACGVFRDVYECPHCGCRFSRPVREEAP